MEPPFVDIHTHRPTGRNIELRTAGIHPWQAADYDRGALLAGLAGAQAIGEIGLDGLRGPAEEVQLHAFRDQLALAEERGLPVVLHCVRRFEAVMRELRGRRLRAVIFHGFTGSPEQAREALARGCCLSFGERSLASPRARAALRTTPEGQLFLETDDNPVPIGEIYRLAAAERATQPERLRDIIFANYERIFTHG